MVFSGTSRPSATLAHLHPKRRQVGCGGEVGRRLGLLLQANRLRLPELLEAVPVSREPRLGSIAPIPTFFFLSLGGI